MFTLTSTGKLWHDDGTALTNWTQHKTGAATIAAAGSEIILTSTVNTDECSIFYNSALPDDGVWVARTKVRASEVAPAPVWLGTCVLYIYPKAVTPTGDEFDQSIAANMQPASGYYNFFGFNRFAVWGAADMDAAGWPRTAHGYDEYFIAEAESVGVGNVEHKARLFTDSIASLLHTATKTATRTADKCWLGITGIKTAGVQNNFGSCIVDYAQAMLSTDITVTGLPTGYAVRLYNSAGALIASAVEAGAVATPAVATPSGTAVLALAGVVGFDTNTNPTTADGGFFGTIKVYSDAGYSNVLDVFSAYDFWGGDTWAWTLPEVAPVTTPITVKTTSELSVKIEIWNPAGTQQITTLSTSKLDALETPYEVEFTKNEHGDSTASFKLKRPARAYFPDLADSNRVKIKIKSDRDWVGDVESVARDVSESSVYAVSCVGPQAKLKQNGTTATHTLDLAPNEKASTYITDHIVTDSYLGLTAGTLTDTFQFVTGYEWYPGRSWADILDELCKYQLNRWYVDKDYRLHFVPLDILPSYQVFMADCKQTHLDKNRDAICNWVQVGFTPDGTNYGYVTAQDTVSQSLHDMRRRYEQLSNKGTQAEAQAYADTYITLHSKLKPSSSLPADIIYDANRSPVFPEEVEGGKILYIPDLLSAEESNPQTLNEMCTWTLAEVKWKDGYVSLSPGDLPTELDVLGAKWGSRDKAMGL